MKNTEREVFKHLWRKDVDDFSLCLAGHRRVEKEEYEEDEKNQDEEEEDRDVSKMRNIGR